jgi:hypoxanthine phosphoribosyltransferase
MQNRIKELYSAAEIAARIESLAAEIAKEYGEREITVLGVLEDSFVFLADLLRQLKIPVYTAFLRYDHRSLGGLQDLTFSTQIDLTNRTILLVEGVMDTGVTQAYITEQLRSQGASDVRLCVLVNKPDKRRVSLEPDWYAFESHDEYVFGFGLAFNERWRELRFLATFDRDEKAGENQSER